MIAVTQARAANLFTLCAAVVAAFHVALVLGAPWGALTLGGRYPGTLPPSARGIAALSATLLVAFIVIMRMRAGLLWLAQAARVRWLAWGVVLYCALGVLANAVTPSASERLLWLPVVTVMLLASIRVVRAPAP